MPPVDPVLAALVLAAAACLVVGPCALDERGAVDAARRELTRLGVDPSGLALEATKAPARLLGRRYWDVSFHGDAREADGRVLVSARSGWVIATILSKRLGADVHSARA